MDIEFAKKVIRAEGEAVLQLEGILGDGFDAAGELILERTGERYGECQSEQQKGAATGRLIITGVGKAGKIGDKLSATFASTGTPSHFLNPTDALHGDLGMVSKLDVVLIISNSGKTTELIKLVPHIHKIGAAVVVMTGDTSSPLAAPEMANITIDMGTHEEAGDLGLAPSCSTTVMLALGDALALTIQRERNFTGELFARFHPGGALASKAVRVLDIMRTDARVAICAATTSMSDAVGLITEAKSGSVLIADEDKTLLGILTDGDFRRAVAMDAEALSKEVAEFMTPNPKSIKESQLVGDAMALMRDKKINELPVVDERSLIVGLVDIQDLVGLRLEL